MPSRALHQMRRRPIGELTDRPESHQESLSYIRKELTSARTHGRADGLLDLAGRQQNTRLLQDRVRDFVVDRKSWPEAHPLRN